MSTPDYTPADQARAIESVLAEAARAVREAEAQHSRLSPSKTCQRYIDGFCAIDLRPCPEDFRSAFLDFVTVLQNWLPHSKVYDDVSFRSFFINTIDVLTLGWKHLSTAKQDMKQFKQNAQGSIQRIKEVALKYGAKSADCDVL